MSTDIVKYTSDLINNACIFILFIVNLTKLISFDIFKKLS